MWMGMKHAWGEDSWPAGVWWGNLRERDCLDILGSDRSVLKWVLQKWDREAWNGLL